MKPDKTSIFNTCILMLFVFGYSASAQWIDAGTTIHNNPITDNVAIGSTNAGNSKLRVDATTDLGISSWHSSANNGSWAMGAFSLFLPAGHYAGNRGALYLGASLGGYGLLESGQSGSRNAMLNPLSIGTLDPGLAMLRVDGNSVFDGKVNIGTSQLVYPLQVESSDLGFAGLISSANTNNSSWALGAVQDTFPTGIILNNHGALLVAAPTNAYGILEYGEVGSKNALRNPLAIGSLDPGSAMLNVSGFTELDGNAHVSGSLNIGITQYAYPLQVQSSSAFFSGLITNTNPSDGSFALGVFKAPVNFLAVDPGALFIAGPSDGYGLIEAGVPGSRNVFTNPLAIGSNDPGSATLSVNGNTGIRTTAPAGDLHVVGSGYGASVIIAPDPPEGDGNSLLHFLERRGENKGQWSGMSIGYDGGRDILLVQGAVDQAVAIHPPLAITRLNGFVGLGTATPSVRLHVAGQARIDSTLRIGPLDQTSLLNSDYRLAVDGKIVARELVITGSGWADFVFADDYRLPSLDEVEQYIEEQRHLPGIPTADEVAESGIAVGVMQSSLLQKIEELTLYVIEQNHKVRALEAENSSLRELRSSVASLQAQNENLQKQLSELARRIEARK